MHMAMARACLQNKQSVLLVELRTSVEQDHTAAKPGPTLICHICRLQNLLTIGQWSLTVWVKF